MLGGVHWGESAVRHILTNQQYAGAVVYNKTTQRLKTKRRHNPREKWIVKPGAYRPVTVIAPEGSILNARPPAAVALSGPTAPTTSL